MRLTTNIDFEKLSSQMDGFSGAEIRAVCTEAGYFAIRKDRSKVKEFDFIEAINKVKSVEDETDYLQMFG